MSPDIVTRLEIRAKAKRCRRRSESAAKMRQNPKAAAQGGIVYSCVLIAGKHECQANTGQVVVGLDVLTAISVGTDNRGCHEGVDCRGISIGAHKRTRRAAYRSQEQWCQSRTRLREEP
jgi:hypothetical protein